MGADKHSEQRKKAGRQRLAIPLVALAAVFAVAFAGQQAAADSEPNDRPAVENNNTDEAGRPADRPRPSGTSDQSKETVQDDGDGATTEVQVNGEALTVPKNGTYQRTTEDDNGRTDVKVENRNQSHTSGDGSHNSSSSEVRIDVRSESSTSQGG